MVLLFLRTPGGAQGRGRFLGTLQDYIINASTDLKIYCVIRRDSRKPKTVVESYEPLPRHLSVKGITSSLV